MGHVLLENFLPDLYKSLDAATHSGHFKIIKWLIENNTDKNLDFNRSLIKASAEGHLEIAKWAVENGSEKDADFIPDFNEVLMQGSHKGHLEIVKWAIKNNASEIVFSRDFPFLFSPKFTPATSDLHRPDWYKNYQQP